MTVAIIGGGAAGLFLGNLLEDATIFEGMDRVGKKLLATGNGRCNLSNVDMDLEHFHGDPNLIEGVFKRASQEEVLAIFDQWGLSLITEDRGRYYPRTYQAASVLNLLRRGLEERDQVQTEREIKKIAPTRGGYRVYDQEGQVDFFEKVVLATGGLAMPSSGSRGQGYKLAQDLGLRLTETFPALVQVKTGDPFLKHLAGVKLEGRLDLLVNGELKASHHGELLITKYGLSGPPILDSSRQAISAYRAKKKVALRFSLLNGVQDFDEAYKYLEEKTYQHFYQSLDYFLQGLVHKKFIHVILKTLDLNKETPLQDLDYQDLVKLWKLMASYEMSMTGYLSYDQAQVTCGGLDTRDFKGNLEARAHQGLYAIGEVLDVDGDCGGYNLQWAWSSALAVYKDLVKK